MVRVYQERIRAEMRRANRTLPEAVAERISALNGSRVELLSYRLLTEDELTAKGGGLNCFSIHTKHLIDRDFLSEKERSFLNEKVMRAKLIQPNSEEIDVILKKWDLKKEINGDYNAVFTVNRVWIPIVLHPSSSSSAADTTTSSNILQIWTFRIPNGQLWFVIVRL